MAPDKRSAVDPKTLSSVTQMLTTANADTVMQGIELVRSLDDEALCEALLEGVVYEPGDGEENGRLVPNETFGGSDAEEQSCLNLALLGQQISS